ncbi:hypothetical protein C4579_02460 [Candidatus Microgenomates bacterium]|nr:MAG: hypothetical protein C4579_02460 [Candidatus Microgenomates bacterium]
MKIVKVILMTSSEVHRAEIERDPNIAYFDVMYTGSKISGWAHWVALYLLADQPPTSLPSDYRGWSAAFRDPTSNEKIRGCSVEINTHQGDSGPEINDITITAPATVLSHLNELVQDTFREAGCMGVLDYMNSKGSDFPLYLINKVAQKQRQQANPTV